ncbi:MAG: DUF523 domain-containing protein [Clostridiales bacterium]|nr:DUF523 domain-containing protein [Clostridiales bacterium]
MNVLISGCLLGINCRYDGKGNLIPEISELLKKHNLIPVCPEQLGGLVTPREAAEIRNGRVVTKSGIDITEEFTKGALEVLRLAKLYGCTVAILKERSPSCGSNCRYDGTFSGTLIAGDGITAELLKENGITVYGESDLSQLL